jgi:hypothetical protein
VTESHRHLDPIRGKTVGATPEEGVRQALLRYFLDTLKVPPRLLAVEYDLRNLDANQRGRLDIVAFKPGGQGLTAWAIAECKAPDIAIDEKTARQLERYVSVLSPEFLVATNGHATIVLHKKKDGRFSAIPSMPVYAIE